MKKPKAPCGVDCPDRSTECKITCDKWKVYEAAIQTFRENRERERKQNAEYDGYIKHRMHGMYKGR